MGRDLHDVRVVLGETHEVRCSRVPQKSFKFTRPHTTVTLSVDAP
jgi:hypothetical protein